MGHLKKGFVQLYTGGGKGKTTAALGLALRAAGAGLKVFIAQFAKGASTAELAALKKISRRISVRQFGARSFIVRRPTAVDCALAAKGLAAAQKIIDSGRFDVVVLDELCVACTLGLVPVKTVVSMIRSRPAHVEIVLTGRDAPRELVEEADLVTEMKEIKHYFAAGITGRRGIEF